MRHTSPQQISSPVQQSPERSLAIATAIACLIAVVCRLLARLISDHHAELDGFIFLAAIFWGYSAVGYFAAVAKQRRQRTANRRWGLAPIRSAIIATLGAGLLGAVVAL
ncbi:hypothetical protein [Lacipirellula parvula]|uniref:Uncharacterized protein n=1 Tax=Lacipirellula parvula TaxID=2650471 RepID=A0A5K7XG45_9BACT|nr:hypothetical protein [Lacipirellula parvula]BBO33246.1 hypothetical protein PLANPX_2858 [Lacipirellula parvula]